MLINISADRFLTQRRIIEIRQILPDIEQYLAETTDPARQAWLERMKKDFLDELAFHEAKLAIQEST